MAKVKLARGTQSAYNGLSTKDTDTIYVCTDTGNIYLGSTCLFESSAYIDSSISGKTVTFTTHGTNGTNSSDTLDLSSFATTSEVTTAIEQAVSSVYRPSGTLAASGIASSLLVADNEGNVYNVSEAFTVGSGSGQVPASLFADAAAGNSYPAGTNIVVINNGTSSSPSYKFDVLAGFVDLSGYATKVTNATSGNFAGLDSNGNITDSGNKASDFKTKQTAKSDPAANGTTLTAIATISQDANGEITATKKTIQSASASQSGVMSSDHYSKLEGIDAGAQVNVLEGVKVSGTALPISSKTVNIATGTAYDASTNKVATMADIVAPGTLSTDSVLPQAPLASEPLSGSVSLHRLSKTGDYEDVDGRLVVTDDTANHGIVIGRCYATTYLRFTARAANSTVQLTAVGEPDAVALECSVNREGFTAYTIGDTITLQRIGDFVEFRHAGDTAIAGLSKTNDDYYKFVMTGTIAASGNAMSLLDATMESVSVGAYCFRTLFYGCTSLVTAPALPATTLAANCYRSMFYGCTSLVTAPALPATTLASNCYYSMFSNCTSLVTAPALPATTLASNCYRGMFSNCTSLVTAPALPATTLVSYCYYQMFYNCRNVTSHHVATLNSYSYQTFYNNSSCEAFTIDAATPPTIGSTTITGLKATCVIYVPAESVAAYKTATYWSARADYIQAIPTE
mgnify:CR=1 FL=1